MIVRAYRNNAYDCVIMSMLFFGCAGLINPAFMPIKPSDICLVVCFTLFLIFKKAPIIKKTVLLVVAYGAVFFCFAFFSDELLSVQVFMWRRCLGFAFFIIPIVIFSRRKFEFMDFWNRLFPYVLLLCLFYIIDAYILCGHILMPGTINYGQSTFYEPAASPLSFDIVRKYPQGLYLLFLLIYPVAKYFKLKAWQWTIIILALISTQTFTIITAVLFTYVLFCFGVRRLLWVILACILAMGLAYWIDGFLPTRQDDYGVQSKLRIKSSIDQFIALSDAVDEEDLAAFASGRMAQVLPRIDMIANEHRQLIGLGFLNPEKNTVKRYEIENELYTDISASDEVIAEVEIAVVQVYVWTGFLGLIIHFLYLLALYLLVRKLPESTYFSSIFFCCFITGMGGFACLSATDGILLLAMAFSAIILAARDRLPGFSAITK